MFSAGLLLFGSSRTEMYSLFAAPLIGAGCAGMQAVAAALSADLFPEKRGVVLNACQVAFAFGAVVGPGTVYMLLVNGTPWQAIYFGMSGLAAALAVVIAAQPIVSGIRDAPHIMSANIGNLLRQPVFVGLCIAQLLYAGAEVGFFEWMPTYFDKSLHAGEFWVGKVVSVFWMAMMVGRLLLGALLGRFETLKIGIFLALAGAAGSLLALNTSRPLFVMLFVAHTGLCFGGIFSTILVEAGDRYHSRAVLGTVVGGISAASNAGTATIPWAVGALAASFGSWRPGLCLVPISAILSAVVLAFVRTGEKVVEGRGWRVEGGG
jgi:FHS family glucose/mannose:H+ symporter-like MFS transporter